MKLTNEEIKQFLEEEEFMDFSKVDEIPKVNDKYIIGKTLKELDDEEDNKDK